MSELQERAIEPLDVPPTATIRPPGSKSLTNRALVIAALAEGVSTLNGALDSDDTRVMVESLSRLGFAISHEWESRSIRVEGRSGRIPQTEASLFVGNSGTSLRFLTALVGLGEGTFRLDGVPRMRERPAQDLLNALGSLGVDARSDAGTGCPPVTVRAAGLTGGYALVRGDVSSQFLSALLMVLPCARERTTIEVEGPLVSLPYVTMTRRVMEAYGVSVNDRASRKFYVEPSKYCARDYAIEPDASAASYFFAAAAVTGGCVTIQGLGTESTQGDLRFVDVLEHMGCEVESTDQSTTVRGPAGGGLRGVDVDMNAISDTVMTLGAVALFATGPTRLRQIAHVRHKETDRITALATELRRLGGDVDEYPDGLVIHPPAVIRPARVATYDDHRMAMSLAIVGLRTPGVVILDPGCVAKTYPGYWDDFERLRPK
jgi:3-phosphoshikimate 1-carboxyvinyltransferase